MSLLTNQLEQIQIVEESNLTLQDKEILFKAINQEIPWTPEVDQLFDQALKDYEV